jgi:hypothetical protein
VKVTGSVLNYSIIIIIILGEGEGQVSPQVVFVV